MPRKEYDCPGVDDPNNHLFFNNPYCTIYQKKCDYKCDPEKCALFRSTEKFETLLSSHIIELDARKKKTVNEIDGEIAYFEKLKENVSFKLVKNR